MTASIVYPQGTSTEITIPAGESIAVYCEGVAQVYRVVGYPNVPNTKSLLGEVSGGQTVYGSYSSGATIVIEAGAQPAYYTVGTAPVVAKNVNGVKYQGAPTAMTTAATITVAGLLGGIITGTHAAGATQAYTLPTGAVMDAASEFAVGESFDVCIINLSAAAADTITLTAASGFTIVGNAIVQSAHSSTGGIYGNSAQYRCRKTAADTFVAYRIA